MRGLPAWMMACSLAALLMASRLATSSGEATSQRARVTVAPSAAASSGRKDAASAGRPLRPSRHTSQPGCNAIHAPTREPTPVHTSRSMYH